MTAFNETVQGILRLEVKVDYSTVLVLVLVYCTVVGVERSTVRYGSLDPDS